MRQLMISLDKKILDPASAAAKRMVEYGKTDEYYIIIPSSEKKSFDLSPTVHVFSTGGNKLIQYLRLKKLGVNLMTQNSIKFITVQDPSYIGNVGSWLKKKYNATLEIQLHGDFYGSDFYRKSLKDLIGYYLFGKRNIYAADKIRVVSERVKKSLIDLKVEEKRIYLKPVPIFESNRLVTRQMRDLKNEYNTFLRKFLYVGRLEEVKNVEWLIDIFGEIIKNHLRNYVLLIIGEGSQLSKIRQLVEQKNLESNIVCKGWSNEIEGWYSTADCLLIPSLSESYSRVAMEAFTAGTPIIMNDVGVANYELKPGPKVTVLPINDKDAWVEAILKA